jgi:hypothetical protein
MRYLTVKKKSRRVGDAADMILPVGILGLGALVAWKLGLFSQSASAQNAASLTAANQAATASTASSLAAQGINPTLSAATLQSIASSIYTAGIQTPPDAATVTNSLSQVNNLADLNQVIAYFGTKNIGSSNDIINACADFSLDCTAVDLTGFLQVVYQQAGGDYLSTINQFFSAQGINFQVP